MELTMKTMLVKKLVSIFTVLLFSFFLAHTTFSEETVTVVGNINNDFQLVTDDGNSYEIGATEKGDEAADLVGSRVEVTGKLVEVDGAPTLLITSFMVISRGN